MSSIEFKDRVKIIDKIAKESPSKLENTGVFDMEITLQNSINHVRL